MKNILIISYAFPLKNMAGAFRPYNIAKCLNKNRFKVKVLTCGLLDASLDSDTSFDKGVLDFEIIGFEQISTVSSFADSVYLKNQFTKFFASKSLFLSNFILNIRSIFWLGIIKIKSRIRIGENIPQKNFLK